MTTTTFTPASLLFNCPIESSSASPGMLSNTSICNCDGKVVNLDNMLGSGWTLVTENLRVGKTAGLGSGDANCTGDKEGPDSKRMGNKIEEYASSPATHLIPVPKPYKVVYGTIRLTVKQPSGLCWAPPQESVDITGKVRLRVDLETTFGPCAETTSEQEAKRQRRFCGGRILLFPKHEGRPKGMRIGSDVFWGRCDRLDIANVPSELA
ncbi:hypothetical protein F5877DRAFT_73370 [Lentinula edodes]|nr:hypothetical protein F5877DRAFT_73370 [Lentinula edodes]